MVGSNRTPYFDWLDYDNRMHQKYNYKEVTLIMHLKLWSSRDIEFMTWAQVKLMN